MPDETPGATLREEIATLRRQLERAERQALQACQLTDAASRAGAAVIIAGTFRQIEQTVSALDAAAARVD